jgi:hypothetical protein
VFDTIASHDPLQLRGFSGCDFEKIQIRVVGKRWSFYTTEAQVKAATRDIVYITKKGMTCLNGEQPDGYCLDYEVRFCCSILFNCS